ncbi:hypothetical protein [Lepagella muris]|jgi:hypothetical protein|nr:hypothetical protein [Lepagella muris]
MAKDEFDKLDKFIKDQCGNNLAKDIAKTTGKILLGTIMTVLGSKMLK